MVVLILDFRPRISASSPFFITPLSTLPVVTVPLPAMENTSSIGRRNGLSSSLTGVGIQESTCSSSFKMDSFPNLGSLSYMKRRRKRRRRRRRRRMRRRRRRRRRWWDGDSDLLPEHTELNQ